MNLAQLRIEIFNEKKIELAEEMEKKWKKNDLQTFQFLSANLSKCMPHVQTVEHKSIYFNILASRILQNIDTQFSEKFDTIADLDKFNYPEIKKSLPALFVSYHLGAYKSALAFLIKYNIDVVLIVDPMAYKVNGDKMTEQFLSIKKAMNSTSDLIFYPADTKGLTLKLMEKTRKGYSILAFIDGNTGANGYFDRNNTECIPFLGQNIFVKNGLPTLSFYLKCPIIPMISFYDDQLKPRWEIHEPIQALKEDKPDEYVTRSTKYLYSILETAVKKSYSQWDGWMFLHRYIDISPFGNLINTKDPPQQISDTIINTNTGLFIIEDKFYALNKENYKILEVTENIFTAITNKMPEAMFANASEVSLLYKNGFLKDKNNCYN